VRRLISLSFVIACILTGPASGAAQGPGSSKQAQELLRQARMALGGSKFQEIRSLSISGDLRRVSANQDQTGAIKLDFLLPDKLKKTETLNLVAGIELTLVTALNGDQAWTDSSTNSGTAQVTVIRPGAQNKNLDTNQSHEVRAEFARYMLALLLAPPRWVRVDFTYGGAAEAPDGRADVIDVKGQDGFVARLFLDGKTHRPLMISYRGIAPRMAVKRPAGSAAGPEDIDRIVKEAQKEAPPRQEAEMEIRLSDYRDEGGILLPHYITKSVDGKVAEEWKINKLKVNPEGLKPEKFLKK
jgi:hypothetical protein